MNTKVKSTHIRVHNDVCGRLNKIAARTGETRTEIVRRLLDRGKEDHSEFIAECRRRCSNTIKNTNAGKWLAQALDRLEGR